MDTINADQLAKALDIPPSRAEVWIIPLNSAMEKFEINTPQRISAFIAQVGWESGYLSRLAESLNYSVDGLLKTFPTHFTAEQAQKYARRPVAIANHVYANRMGNGDENSGDGWSYRGAGLIQLTGKNNQAMCAQFFGITLDKIGDWLRTNEGGALSAGWYWKMHGCNELADAGEFYQITKVINGGLNNLQERMALWDKAKAIFK